MTSHPGSRQLVILAREGGGREYNRGGGERVTETKVEGVGDEAVDERYDPDGVTWYEASIMIHKGAHARRYPIGSVKDTPSGRRHFEGLIKEIEEIVAEGQIPWLPYDDLGPPSYEWPSDWRPR
jgi:hypothetical protein